MATSAEYLQQLEGMKDMPNFREEVVGMYDTPVLQPLVQERSKLESSILPTLFASMGGTQASDMSPEAKLSARTGDISRIFGNIGANQSIQNYYGGQIDNLVNQRQQDWQNRYNTIQNLYNAQYQREAEQRALEESRRARAAASGGGIDLSGIQSYLQSLNQNPTEGFTVEARRNPLSVVWSSIKSATNWDNIKKRASEATKGSTPSNQTTQSKLTSFAQNLANKYF